LQEVSESDDEESDDEESRARPPGFVIEAESDDEEESESDFEEESESEVLVGLFCISALTFSTHCCIVVSSSAVHVGLWGNVGGWRGGNKIQKC
jgi:predicted neutral ceramidase superfamily lipid hydrolase